MSDIKRIRFCSGTVIAAMASLLMTAGCQEPRASAPELTVPVLFEAQASCALSGEQARARGRESERNARARWERVPYAVGEGLSAIQLLDESVQCYRAGGDREGRARAESDLAVWKRELERSYARGCLNLTLAVRSDDAEASLAEARSLLALLAKAGTKADPYRSFLMGVERASRAAHVERLRRAEKD